MTPAELRVITEWLGLRQRDVAGILGVEWDVSEELFSEAQSRLAVAVDELAAARAAYFAAGGGKVCPSRKHLQKGQSL